MLLVVSGAAIALALIVGGNIAWFYYHSHTRGAKLLKQAQDQIDRQRSAGAGKACRDPAAPATDPAGIVGSASIGMKAPVVQGDGDSQLAVAVGHDPDSVWPDAGHGTVVLEAHDVSYFSSIDHLATGSQVTYQTPCHTYVYTVTAHQVVERGAPVANTSAPSLALVTCYPVDALWITSKRYVVLADLTSVRSGGSTIELPASTAGSVTTALPTGVADEVSSRVTTSGPLGALGVTGSPGPSWEQSTQAVNATGSVLTLYFGVLQLAAQEDASGWAAAAPGLSRAAVAPLWGEEVESNLATITPTLEVEGSTLVGATVTSEVRLGDGGVYRMRMHAGVRRGLLTVTGWETTAAG